MDAIPPYGEIVKGTQQIQRLVIRPATRWNDHLQQASLRNAMVASTALAQLRLESLEVEEFLAQHERRDEGRRPGTGQHTVRRTG
jgi:hypothetical protein